MLLKTNTNKINELVHRIAKAYGASIETEYVCDGTGEYADSCSMYFVIRYGFAVKKSEYQITLRNTKTCGGKKI